MLPPLRAFCPLCPRPLVLPLLDPGPRPTRRGPGDAPGLSCNVLRRRTIIGSNCGESAGGSRWWWLLLLLSLVRDALLEHSRAGPQAAFQLVLLRLLLLLLVMVLLLLLLVLVAVRRTAVRVDDRNNRIIMVDQSGSQSG